MFQQAWIALPIKMKGLGMIKFDNKLKHNRKGSSIAEFGPALALLLFALGFVICISLFFLTKITLQFACDNAVRQTSASFNRDQAIRSSFRPDEQLRKGIIGLFIEPKQAGDGISFALDPVQTNTNNQATCYVEGQYHIRMLCPGYNFVLKAGAHGQLEHPEGFRNGQ